MSPLSVALRRSAESQSAPGPSLPVNVEDLTENATLRRTQAHHVMSIERMVEEGAEIVPGVTEEELGPEDSISQGRPEEERVTVQRTGLGTYRRVSGVGGELVWLELTPSERGEISTRELKRGRIEEFEPEDFFQ